ncbi:beta-3 adrenergic receptor-like [Babylonia areolata]|uniref:beta-3 adrenergic receptor-like n=1 Tax=Babylonia areolata TaxID=304850 RepID=UPI003FD0BBC4
MGDSVKSFVVNTKLPFSMTMNNSSTTPTYEWNPSAPYFTMGAQVLMFIAIATVNILTLVVMAMTPKLQTIPNMYIAALAVSDLVVSFNQVMAIPWTSPEHHVHFENHSSLCMFFKCLLHINELTSLFIIAVIGMDRFLYIQHPFWYLRIVTKRKVKVTVVMVWCLSFVIALSFRMSDSGDKYPGCDSYALLYDSETAGYFNGVLFFLICSVLFVAYGIVIRSAVKQARAIQALLPRTVTPPSNTEAPPLRVHEQNVEASLSLKIVQKMAGVFLMLFVCWTPYVLIGLIGPKSVDHRVVLMSGFLAAFNSAANFGVYALADREFRSATFRILRCNKDTNSSTRPSSVTTLTQSDPSGMKQCCRGSSNGELTVNRTHRISDL